jgi:hypothetical protein
MVVKWLVVLGVAAAVFALSIHQIPEGHVGIYYRQIRSTFFYSIITLIYLSILQRRCSPHIVDCTGLSCYVTIFNNGEDCPNNFTNR